MSKQPATKPTTQRAINLGAYLQRYIPYWGNPSYLAAARWRALVRNQPIAIVCRDTLIMNLLSMDWSISAKDSTDTTRKTKSDVAYYTDMLQTLEGDFDLYVELMAQDILDLPFGAACEVFRENDDENGDVLFAEHIDGASLFPTQDYDFPVMQKVPEIATQTVTFPRHAIERIFMTPRPEIGRKGWGCAPPEKAYLAIELLYRGDKYYANLLLDTPEAGILDLVDFSETAAKDWLASMKELFAGIDGMKVPVLYEHKVPAQWIELTRPPTDLLYDETTHKYAQILAAAYGMRLSDIGMDGKAGERTLAGVIRGERQTRRSGFALLRSKFFNHFNALLPDSVKFHWEEKDEEAQVSRARALQTVGSALSLLTNAETPLLSVEEARQELIATGLLQIKIEAAEKIQTDERIGIENISGVPGGNGKVPVSQGGRGRTLKSLINRYAKLRVKTPAWPWAKMKRWKPARRFKITNRAFQALEKFIAWRPRKK